ncbi:hypothetical protein Pint_25207 [Pistacia integerrima]|uniref:Uncharacterized protein n=1 Tax=Pistacia integerrima TaxID=434235 RepID=A0ACC0YFT0_9ROSI|nr:hypothetical protein Pint_25207 [Pistacia integerrima]
MPRSRSEDGYKVIVNTRALDEILK